MCADRFQQARLVGAALLFALLPAGAALAQAGAAAAIPAPPQGAWPESQPRQGRYFAFVVPVGWTINETPNGVDIMNPGANEGLNFLGLEGSRGSMSPQQRIEWLFQQLKATNFRFTEIQNRPSQNGFDTSEFLYSYTDAQGRPCMGWAWSAVNNSYGFNNFYGEIAWAGADIWARDAQFMVAAARLVHVTNQVEAFQRNMLIRNNASVGPGSAGGFNHPNTFTPHSNQAAMDRISAQRSNTARDSYPLVDPSTGRPYIGTSSNYDYVRGGWVNPLDRTQLLQPVKPPEE